MHPPDRYCVIGGGRIGLPISVRLSEVGCTVDVLEVDENRVLAINSSTSPFFEDGMQDSLSQAVQRGRIRATTDPKVMSECNIIISAIGTGINDDGTPDIASIESLVELISPNLRQGDLLILKTTLPIGTTERIAAMLSESSGLEMDQELLVAFCPERIVEGKAMFELATLPKIVGGVGKNSTKRAGEVMRLFGGEVIKVSNSRTSEMCKLLDNAYRMTRFGFSADVAAVAHRTGINAFEAIKAANRGYSRNDIPLPSIGVSGYCLTKDPYYLDSSAKSFWKQRGFPSTWVTARMAADLQTQEAVRILREEFGDSLGDKIIVVAGVTYKEGVDDTRLSHGREIISTLSPLCAEIRIWDPLAAEETIDGIPIQRNPSPVVGSDCILFTVPHGDFVSWSGNPKECYQMRTRLIFDGWGIFSDISKLEGVRIIGTGIGYDASSEN